MLSILFLALLIRFVRLEAMGEMLRSMDLVFFILSMLLSVVIVASSCWKWQLLLEKRDRQVQFTELFRYYLIGYYFSNLLPSNIGGDVARSYLLGKRIGSQGRAAVTVFLERFTGMICLLMLVLLAPMARPELYKHPAVAIAVAGAAALLIIFGFMVFMRRPVQRMVRFSSFLTGMIPVKRFRAAARALLERINEKGLSFHGKLLSSLEVLRRDVWRMAKVIFATLLFYVLTWVNVYTAFRTFGVHADWPTIVAMTPPAMFITMLPLAPLGSLGLLEASFTGFFALAGLPSAGGAMMGFLLRFKMLVNGFAGYIFWLQRRNNSFDNDETNKLK